MKKSILIVCFCLSISYLFGQEKYVSGHSHLNLRSAPNGDASITSTIPAGSKVEVIENTNDKWVRVKYNNKTGYVSSKFLQNDKPKSVSKKEDDEAENKNKTNNDSKNNSDNAKNAESTKKKSTSSRKKSSQKTNESSSNSSTSDKTWGLGIKLGDPSGISIKKYFGKNAFEFVFGRPAGYHYNDGYYNSRYNNGYYYNNYNYNYGYTRQRYAIATQIRVLWQYDIPKASGLQWYWGVGAGLAMRKYDVYYNYYNKNYYDNYSQSYTNVDFGIDGIGGLEYTFDNVPVSIFADLNLFIEVADNPGNILLQGGVGVRYNIK